MYESLISAAAAPMPMFAAPINHTVIKRSIKEFKNAPITIGKAEVQCCGYSSILLSSTFLQAVNSLRHCDI